MFRDAKPIGHLHIESRRTYDKLLGIINGGMLTITSVFVIMPVQYYQSLSRMVLMLNPP